MIYYTIVYIINILKVCCVGYGGIYLLNKGLSSKKLIIAIISD